MNYQVKRVNDNLEYILLQEYDNKAEAMAYVIKMADRNILATIWVNGERIG